jgi:hypothetical protein
MRERANPSAAAWIMVVRGVVAIVLGLALAWRCSKPGGAPAVLAKVRAQARTVWEPVSSGDCCAPARKWFRLL